MTLPDGEAERAVAVVRLAVSIRAAFFHEPFDDVEVAVPRRPVQRRAAVLAPAPVDRDVRHVNEPIAGCQVSAARGPVQRAASVRVRGDDRVERALALELFHRRHVTRRRRAQTRVVRLFAGLAPRHGPGRPLPLPAPAVVLGAGSQVVRCAEPARRRPSASRELIPSSGRVRATRRDERLLVRHVRRPRALRRGGARVVDPTHRPVLPQPAAVHGVILPAPRARDETLGLKRPRAARGGDRDLTVVVHPRVGDDVARLSSARRISSWRRGRSRRRRSGSPRRAVRGAPPFAPPPRPSRRRVVSHRVVSHRVASHRMVSHRPARFLARFGIAPAIRHARPARPRVPRRRTRRDARGRSSARLGSPNRAPAAPARCTF